MLADRAIVGRLTRTRPIHFRLDSRLSFFNSISLSLPLGIITYVITFASGRHSEMTLSFITFIINFGFSKVILKVINDNTRSDKFNV